jgi:hypothetical protein
LSFGLHPFTFILSAVPFAWLLGRAYDRPMAWLGKPTQRDTQKAQAYRDWLQKQHPLAVISLVLGVVSIIEAGVLLVFGIGGAATGIIALTQLRRAAGCESPDVKRHGHRLAWSGIVLSCVSLAMAIALYSARFSRPGH